MAVISKIKLKEILNQVASVGREEHSKLDLPFQKLEQLADKPDSEIDVGDVLNCFIEGVSAAVKYKVNIRREDCLSGALREARPPSYSFYALCLILSQITGQEDVFSWDYSKKPRLFHHELVVVAHVILDDARWKSLTMKLAAIAKLRLGSDLPSDLMPTLRVEAIKMLLQWTRQEVAVMMGQYDNVTAIFKLLNNMTWLGDGNYYPAIDNVIREYRKRMDDAAQSQEIPLVKPSNHQSQSIQLVKQTTPIPAIQEINSSWATIIFNFDELHQAIAHEPTSHLNLSMPSWEEFFSDSDQETPVFVTQADGVVKPGVDADASQIVEWKKPELSVAPLDVMNARRRNTNTFYKSIINSAAGADTSIESEKRCVKTKTPTSVGPN